MPLVSLLVRSCRIHVSNPLSELHTCSWYLYSFHLKHCDTNARSVIHSYIKLWNKQFQHMSKTFILFKGMPVL